MSNTCHPSIKLHSGVYFNFLEPELHPYCIEDIAHGLSNICRYNGQCNEFYSVAQHAVLVSYIVESYDTFIGSVFAGLNHDNSEAILGDVTKPLKELLPEYKKIEKSTEDAIFDWLLLPRELPSVVKLADSIALRTEQRDLMNADNENWFFTQNIEPLKIKIIPLAPKYAKRMFLERFYDLQPKYNEWLNSKLRSAV